MEAAAAGSDSEGTEPVAAPSPPPADIGKPSQKKALLQIKAAVDPMGSVLQEWTDQFSHCTWSTVTCDADKNVVKLNMVYLGLNGSLPSGEVLRELPFLTQIYMGGNMLRGELPADWAWSFNATEILLNDNLLTGQLPPQWGSMKNLQVLSLAYNQLSGSLPRAWGSLAELRTLKLNNNRLEGSVPESWVGMAALSTVTVFNNPNVTGCVPQPWSGPGKTGQGYFLTPSGELSDDVKVAVLGTSIEGFCCKGWSYCV